MPLRGGCGGTTNNRVAAFTDMCYAYEQPDAEAGSMKNTKPLATWLNAGWTGYWMIEKNIQVTMREVIGVTGRFKSTAVGEFSIRKGTGQLVYEYPGSLR